MSDPVRLRVLVFMDSELAIDVDRTVTDVRISTHNELMETGLGAYHRTWAQTGDHSVSIDYFAPPDPPEIT